MSVFPGEEDAIEIYTPERPYTIYTRSRAEKRLWLNKLRDTIYHYLLKRGQCERSSTCATGSYLFAVSRKIIAVVVPHFVMLNCISLISSD